MAQATRLVATDLDGTLLGPDSTLSARSERALRAVQEVGIPVVVVTGRPPRFTREFVAHVRGPVICANGALVYDPENDRIVDENPLAGDIAARLIGRMREQAPGVAFAVETGLEFQREAAYRTRFNADIPLADALELVRVPVSKLLVRHPGLDFDKLYDLAVELAGEDANVTHASFDLVEISAAGVTKAFALEKLCAERGVPAGAVMAFGDMPNDLPMLAWAGHAVAVANAHPAVLDVADEVTASNADDGVARVLERLVAS